MSLFEPQHHPHTLHHGEQKPAQTTDEQIGLNGKIAVAITSAVGTMWCAYAFAVLALIALPSAINGGALTMVQWISQTFIQLVMLSIIIVGQNIQGAASDKRAIQTYNDAEAVLHECLQLQAHLKAQDEILEKLVADMKR